MMAMMIRLVTKLTTMVLACRKIPSKRSDFLISKEQMAMPEQPLHSPLCEPGRHAFFVLEEGDESDVLDEE